MDRFEIGRLFHLTHVVGDLDAVDRWYDEVFSVTRFYNGYEELAGRDASLIAIADLVLEPMAPARGRELRNRSVQRFHDRFGEHFHSIAWYVDDVEAVARRLDDTASGCSTSSAARSRRTSGRRRSGPIRRRPSGSSSSPSTPTTSPTHGSTPTGRRRAGASIRSGILGTSHIGIVVRDLAAATRLYCDVLGGALFHERSCPTASAARSSPSATAPSSSSPSRCRRPSPEGRELERTARASSAFVFRTADLDRAQAFLEEHGLTPEPDGEDTIVLGPAEAFGMTVGFTRRAVPDDPRDP